MTDSSLDSAEADTEYPNDALDTEMAALVERHGYAPVLEAAQNAAPEGLCWNCGTEVDTPHVPYQVGACYATPPDEESTDDG